MNRQRLKPLLPLALLVALGVVALMVSCAGKLTPTPTATPTPAPTATPTPPPIGMAFDQRYHSVHVTNLGLECTRCHTQATPAYYDPLAQVFNLADRRACLSCHKESTIQLFYGEEWEKASVK